MATLTLTYLARATIEWILYLFITNVEFYKNLHPVKSLSLSFFYNYFGAQEVFQINLEMNYNIYCIYNIIRKDYWRP